MAAQPLVDPSRSRTSMQADVSPAISRERGLHPRPQRVEHVLTTIFEHAVEIALPIGDATCTQYQVFVLQERKACADRIRGSAPPHELRSQVEFREPGKSLAVSPIEHAQSGS